MILCPQHGDHNRVRTQRKSAVGVQHLPADARGIKVDRALANAVNVTVASSADGPVAVIQSTPVPVKSRVAMSRPPSG
jgi:hypothetical protein